MFMKRNLRRSYTREFVDGVLAYKESHSYNQTAKNLIFPEIQLLLFCIIKHTVNVDKI